MTLSDINKENIISFLETNIDLIDHNNWYALFRKCPAYLITPLLEFIESVNLEIKDAKDPYYVIEDNHHVLCSGGVLNTDFIDIACKTLNYFNRGTRIEFIRFKNPLEAEAFRKRYLFDQVNVTFQSIPASDLKVRIDADHELLKSHRWIRVNTLYGECYIEASIGHNLMLQTPINLLDFEREPNGWKAPAYPNWVIMEGEN